MDKFIKTIWIATRSLGQHKLRSFLSVLGIVCGVMAVLSMISIGEGAKRKVIQQIEQLGTRNIYLKAVDQTSDQRRKARERLSSGLNHQDVKRILTGCQDVHLAATLKEITAAVTDIPREISPQIVATSAGYSEIQNLVLSRGRFIHALDVLQRNMICVIGSDVAARMGAQGKPGQYVRIENHLFRVVGILNRLHRKEFKAGVVAVRNYNEMIFIPIGTEANLARPSPHAQEISNQGLSEVVLQVHRTDQVLHAAKIVDRIVKVAHNSVKDYQMIVPRELLQQARKTQRTFNVVLGAIAGVSLLVGGIGIMNIMLATVTERIREIGIRRAVGANRKNITTQFLVEAVILTFTGGLIGVAAGIGAVVAITTLSGWNTAITLWAIAVPLVMSILVGIFFGLYPAIQAARMDPVAALYHE